MIKVSVPFEDIACVHEFDHIDMSITSISDRLMPLGDEMEFMLLTKMLDIMNNNTLDVIHGW